LTTTPPSEIGFEDASSGAQTLRRGLKELCGTVKTQSGGHIKPVHVHCSHRLTIEGGFPPEWILPSPPLVSRERTRTDFDLRADKRAENLSEHSVLGGIKHKNVDVTVLVPGIGPALGISAKSTGNAFRNLTNRMEEALGDCANIHMMYPGFVFGFLHFIRYATPASVLAADASFGSDGQPLPKLIRYHDVLLSLSGRTTITDPAMRYESVGLVVYKCENGVVDTYPPADSPVHYRDFYERLYRIYDLRYAYPDSSGKSSRKVWSPRGLQFPLDFDADLGFPWTPRLGDDLERI
jgi:hypothetical protein